MRSRRLVVLAALAFVVGFAACTLNPQPLPPGEEAAQGGGASGGPFGSIADESPKNSAPAPAPESGVSGCDGGVHVDASVDTAVEAPSGDAATSGDGGSS